MATIRLDMRGLPEVRSMLADARKQVPFATALALTKTAQAAQGAVRQEMTRVFDRPTPWILNSTYVKPATKANLEAHVYLKDDAAKGLSAAKTVLPQIAGGERSWKRFEASLQRIGMLGRNEIAVPGSAATLDSYGNMSRAQIVQILSYFAAFGEQGYKANMTTARKAKLAKGSRSRYGVRYYLKRDGRGRGIYMATQLGFGSATKPVLMFVRKPAYRPRLQMQRVVTGVFEQQFRSHFAEAFETAMRSAR